MFVSHLSAARRRIVVSILAAGSLLPGCASPQRGNNAKPDAQTSSAGEAAQGGENRDAELARQMDPTLMSDALLSKVPPENIHVMVSQNAEDPDARVQRLALGRQVAKRAASAQATLGNYLSKSAETAPNDQRISILSMAELARCYAARLSLGGGSAQDIEQGSRLQDCGEVELRLWRGRLGVAKADAPEQAYDSTLPAQKSPAEAIPANAPSAQTALENAWVDCGVLMLALGRYGSSLWSPEVLANRRDSARAAAILVESDAADIGRTNAFDPHVVAADMRIGEASRRFTQVLVLASDDSAKKLHALSPEAAPLVFGTSNLDADALQRFCNLVGTKHGSTPTEDDAMRWVVVRALPAKICAGSAPAPEGRASAEGKALLEKTMKDRGLAR